MAGSFIRAPGWAPGAVLPPTQLRHLGYATGLLLAAGLLLVTAFAWAGDPASGSQAPGDHGGGHGGTPTETFVVLDLLSEAVEASVLGVAIKIVELKPKIEHINELYQGGQNSKALALTLGIATEVVVLGFLIETMGVGDLMFSALSFSSGWAVQGGLAAIAVMLSTKVALFAGETVEEAAIEKFSHAIKAEAAAEAGQGASGHTF